MSIPLDTTEADWKWVWLWLRCLKIGSCRLLLTLCLSCEGGSRCPGGGGGHDTPARPPVSNRMGSPPVEGTAHCQENKTGVTNLNFDPFLRVALHPKDLQGLLHSCKVGTKYVDCIEIVI